MIYIVTSKNAAALERALGPAKKNGWAELLPAMPAKGKLQSGDQIYLDISGLSQADLKKAVGLLKKSPAVWGIVDPKGAAEDPGAFFFEGAGDYIGPGLVKKGLDKKRLAAALSWSAGKDSGKTAAAAIEEEAPGKKKVQKIPAGKFGGWKTIRAGTTEAFFFMFISFGGKTNLRSLAGEAAFTALKNRAREVLQQSLREADALLWMETENNSLFLVPPVLENIRAAIEAALKIIVNGPLIGMEKLFLTIPAEFTVALHYGKTTFQAPGKTGAIISEPVNYIFHLGAKKAEPGRLTISDDVSDDAIPEGLLDLFSPAGIFEGIPIRHSRRFIYG